MPINRASKNRLTTFIEEIQKSSDDKFFSLTNSNLKYSRKEIRGQIEKYLRKSIKETLHSYPVKKITEIAHLIIDNVFESQKNFERIIEKESLYLGVVMPFLPNDQIRGHALEKLGFKTICGDLDRKALIERYTLNEITVPDYVPKGAKKQKVGWNDRVTVFEVGKKSCEPQSPVENRSLEQELPSSHDDDFQREVGSSTVKALEFLDETLVEETPEIPAETEKSNHQNEKLNENESSVSIIIPESDDIEPDTSTVSEAIENGNLATTENCNQEKFNKMAQAENSLILQGEIDNSAQEENTTVFKDSAKALKNFGSRTDNFQLNNPSSQDKENISPSRKSSDRESEGEGLEFYREMYARAKEDDFIIRRHSDDEEMRSSLSLPDREMDIANENDESSQEKNNNWVVSSKLIIKKVGNESVREIDNSNESLSGNKMDFNFQEKEEISVAQFRSRQKLNFQSLVGDLPMSHNSQDEAAMKKLIQN